MFVKNGDGKILGIVDDKDEVSKKSAKDASEKIKTSQKEKDKLEK